MNCFSTHIPALILLKNKAEAENYAEDLPWGTYRGVEQSRINGLYHIS